MEISLGVSSVALLLSGWTFYKVHFERPRIRVFFGDSIDIVRHSDGDANSVQLACTFCNLGSKTGIIDKLVVWVEKADARSLFNWQMFCAYDQGHRSVPVAKVHSIQASGKASVFQLIQFHSDSSVAWDVGAYMVRLEGWFNGRTCEQNPNIVEKFSVTLSQGFAADLIRAGDNSGPMLRTVMIDGRMVRAGTQNDA
jgi:hypothetical protein